MNIQSLKTLLCRAVTTFLAVGAAVFLALPAFAAASEVRMNPVSDNVIEIAGGAGGQAWRLQYGKGPGLPVKPLLAQGEGSRAYLSDGTWLRMIDTRKGVVVGRWHFPGHEIVRLTPRGDKVEVEVEEKSSQQGPVFRRIFLFDPSKPVIPFWPSGWLLLYRIPLQEAQQRWPSINLTGAATRGKLAPEEARKLLPSLEEAVRRDPATLWFRIALGKALWDLGDPRGSATFRDAVKLTYTDYTELLPVSSYLDSLGETEAARDAFERAYGDFWERGNDPRLFFVLIGKFFLYQPKSEYWGKLDTPLGREFLERTYKLTPYAEAAEFAWEIYANYLSRKGQAEEAKLWRARAEDSKRGLLAWWGGFGVWGLTDRYLLVLPAALLAGIFYLLVLYFRYRPQRRLDLAARQQRAGLARGFAFFNIEYWSRGERLGFFLIVFASWYAVGIMNIYVSGIIRGATMPIGMGMGTFAGPVSAYYLETILPATPERDLLLAISYQQSGEAEKAERLYRNLPQFPESWNNLGVILKNAGKLQEARQAFEQALRLDPELAEAAVNLAQPPRTFWTEQHQKYAPGRPMMAIPKQVHVSRALLGGGPTSVYWRGLAGPLTGEGLGKLGKLI